MADVKLPMTVKELVEELSCYPDHYRVVVSSDNQKWPIDIVDTHNTHIFAPDGSRAMEWSALEPEELTEDQEKDYPPAVVLETNY